MEPEPVYSVKHSFYLDGRGRVIVPEPEIESSSFRIGDKLSITLPGGSQRDATVKYIEILSSRSESTWVIVINGARDNSEIPERSKFRITELGDCKYAGMTVNERLFAAGLLDEFDQAAVERNRERMIEILSRTAMTPVQCAETTDSILAK